uniref:Uncharacterized protein n=1 Tax=Ciona intestinalis TaxID=7719 RepID=H2XQU0_CIOIN
MFVNLLSMFTRPICTFQIVCFFCIVNQLRIITVHLD